LDFFAYQPTPATWLALVAGLLSIGLSALLILIRHQPYERVAYFVVRDLTQVFGLGFAFPIWFVSRYMHQPLGVIGITWSRWPDAVLVDVVLAVMLALVVAKDHRDGKLHFHAGDVLYLFVTGIFEVVFFYGFLRHYFEMAFGIVPSILLASVFYSLHHIGFEVQMRGNPWVKELSKLTAVGVLYAAVYRIAGGALAIYPLFWGVGAGSDVLLTKEGGDFPWRNAMVVLLLMMAAIGILVR
jgi:membrane protease YdiL (CAAX protease family)